jgi:elongation factor Ts
MMDCKKALESSDGDVQKAVEYLRVKGQAGVAKREGRTASNGLVAAHVADGAGTLVEINCETDFVAKGGTFQQLGQQVLQQAVATGAGDVTSLLQSEVAPGRTLQAVVDEAAASIGEKIEVRRVARLQAPHVASYLHRTTPDLPAQIGVILATDAESPVARDVAMHIAASSPSYLDRDAVPAEVVESERRIAEEKARAESKPDQALMKIVDGRVNAFFKDNVLLEQAFAKDVKKSVSAVLAEAGVSATGFARFRVGY